MQLDWIREEKSPRASSHHICLICLKLLLKLEIRLVAD